MTNKVQRMTRDIHMTGQDLTNMVQLRPTDLGKYAIVPGPKERLDNLVKKLENPIKNFTFMEYSMFTGMYQGIKMTAMNGGRFSADTAITTELLCNAQARHMIRIGSCGALSDEINIGDIIVVNGAIAGEGVTPYYVHKDFKIETDKALTEAIYAVAQKSGHQIHLGKVWSTDAILRETKENVNNAIDQGAIAVDMVSSVFLTLCQLYEIPATVILAVSDNIITGEMGFLSPNYYMAESSLVTIALNLIKKLEEK